MDEINTPHDSFFKRLFGNLAVAADFMRCYLPEEILARLDLETLQLEKESFIDPDLRGAFSDLLFSVKAVSEGEVFIYLLVEHKSTPEPWVAFQLLRYIVRFWERQRDQGCERLPLIIPIVFYHGQERWNVSRRLHDLVKFGEVAELQKYIPDLEYDLRDVSLSGGQEIKGQPKLRTGLEILRYIFSDDLIQRLPGIFRNLREMKKADAVEYARMLAAYLSSARKKFNKEVIKAAMQEAFATEEFDKSALFIQEWIEEGIEIGEHKALLSLTLRQARHILGEIDGVTQERIQALPNLRLEELGEALLGFKTLADLHKWLADNLDQA